MADSKVLLLAMAMAMAAAALFAGSSPAGAAHLIICGRDATNLTHECRNYVRNDGPQLHPSAACCHQVRNFDMPCLCRSLPPAVERVVSIEKIVYVTRICGSDIPRGTVCGGYVVPLGGADDGPKLNI